MKRKQIEKVAVKRPEGKGWKKGKRVAAQLSGGYLILDLWSDGTWIYRHAVDLQTGEYASCDMTGLWTQENLNNAFARGEYWIFIDEESFPLSKKERELALDALKVNWPGADVYERIGSLEREYSSERRDRKEARRVQRVNDLMDSVPDVCKPVMEWISGQVAGSLHYAIWDKTDDTYQCTACGQSFAASSAGAKMKHRGDAICPLCGQALTVEKRRSSLQRKASLTLIHRLDEKRGIQRHFDVTVDWEIFRVVKLHETIRCMLHKGAWSMQPCEYYYAQHDGWDNKGNPFSLRWKTGYLYPEGVREGLEGTAYHAWADVLQHIAAQGMKANYDRIIADTRKGFIGTVEYLAKGRFRRLLEETSNEVNYTHGYGSWNALDISGRDICAVMRIRDMQKINRLRQEDGGNDMLEWMQWADKAGKRIGSDVLSWYGRSGITNAKYRSSRASRRLSPEQLMNYLNRQVTESYGGKRKAKAVFETYEDYLSMSESLGKDMSDAMVYRPRELKRRHGEAVEENNRRIEAERARMDREQARKDAERMEEKYPGSEAILAAVRPKYEYEGERFRITVPHSFIDIVSEGMALHHCVGNTERYFDRILQHETYICFLRRAEEPGKPFYTIEVEPGGTIRQHRGMYDEEPDIEEVKPFLREWQKEIRKRMREEDHEHARLSAVKREQNLEELRRKNNTRVLEALMEDLMEVV